MSAASEPGAPRGTGTKGEYLREPTRFREWVTADGSSGFRAEPGRYYLYVSYACPWAHRTIIVRRLKGLEDVVGMLVVDPIRDDRGWRFTGADGTDRDRLNGFEFLAEAYEQTKPGYDGRVNVPVLWDTRDGVIVNNESADIIRILNSAFDEWGDPAVDLCPSALVEEIDVVNERVYETVNNGVYRAGFARSQEAYQEAAVALFETLDWLEERLSAERYLCGDRITEADWRLFTTCVRFDAVYYTHFKCNVRRLVDYPRLWTYVRDLYQRPGIAETVVMDHIKRHYYRTHRSINPRRIVPIGPEIDFAEPIGDQPSSRRRPSRT